MQLAAAEARLARSARVPDLGLLMGARRTRAVNGVGLMMGVSTKLPLWSGAGTQADAAEAHDRAARLARAKSRGASPWTTSRCAPGATRPGPGTRAARPGPAGSRLRARADRGGVSCGGVSGLEPIEARRALREVDLFLIDVRGELRARVPNSRAGAHGHWRARLARRPNDDATPVDSHAQAGGPGPDPGSVRPHPRAFSGGRHIRLRPGRQGRRWPRGTRR